MSDAEHVPERLLRVREVCERTALGKSAVWEMIARGDMPSVKIGGSRRVREADLDEWIRRQAGEWVLASSPAVVAAARNIAAAVKRVLEE